MLNQHISGMKNCHSNTLQDSRGLIWSVVCVLHRCWMKWWWIEAHLLTCPMLTCTSMDDSSPQCRGTVRTNTQLSPAIWCQPFVSNMYKVLHWVSQRWSINMVTRLPPLSLSSRCDSVHTYRQHSICSSSRSLDDPPQRTGHHGHPHLPALALLQAYCRACWGRAHGNVNNSCFMYMHKPERGLCLKTKLFTK